MFLVVLLAHAAAWFVVQWSMRLSGGRQAAESAPLIVSFLTPLPPAAAPAAGPRAPRRRQESLPHPQLVPAAKPSAEVPSGAITDWGAEAAAAARDIASGAGRPGHPFTHEFSQAHSSSSSGVFGPKNEHPAGSVERFEEGERYWVTDNCYFEKIDRRAPVPEIAGPHVMTPTCKPAATGGTDMFRQQAPGYLRPPAAAAGDPPVNGANGKR
jgi:hypothetical protein